VLYIYMKSCCVATTTIWSYACMQYTTGCLLTCDDIPKNGSCSCKTGCCQLDLQKGVQYYQGFFNPLSATTKIWSSHSCNYITVMESSAFNFSTTSSPRRCSMTTQNNQGHQLWWNGRLHGTLHVRKPKSTRRLMLVLATIAIVARMMRATYASA